MVFGDANRRQWLALLHRHAAMVQRELAAIQHELQPVFAKAPPRTAAPVPVVVDSDLPLTVTRLFEAVSQIDHSIRRSLSSSSSDTAAIPVEELGFWELLRYAEGLSSGVYNYSAEVIR